MNGSSGTTSTRALVRADITEPDQHVALGEPAVFEVEITNLDSVIRSYDVDVLGLDRANVVVEPSVNYLFPGERQLVTVTITLPADHPAGRRTLGIEISDRRPDGPPPAVVEVTVSTPGQPSVVITAEPASQEVGKTGTFLVHPTNTGNTLLDIGFEALDPERLVTTTFDPPQVTLRPGEQAVVRATAVGKRPWAGTPAMRVLEVGVTGEDVQAVATVVLLQRPRISRMLISLFGLLLVVTLFAFVISLSFGRVAELSAANEALVAQGLGLDDETAGRGVSAAVSGQVASSTGSPIDGAAVRLFTEDNLLRPVRSTVTDEAGAYRFGGVDDGVYLVQAEAAGFGLVWLPGVFDIAEADTIEVADGASLSDLVIVLTGRPGSVSGRVLGDDVEGAIVTVQLPAATIEGSTLDPVASIVREVPVDATGVFVLADLATPATYEIQVAKEGFATEPRTVTLGAGEQREDLEILLRRGIGLIAGQVVDTAGAPLGGVTITATDGKTQATTRSLSGADTDGTFELRDLTTPGTYTLTFSLPGYFDETATLRLQAEQQRNDVFIVMTAAEGSVSGTVRRPDGSTLGGVTVTVVGANVTRTTRSLTVAPVGTWNVAGLPVPGTYTITFQRPDLTTTALSVELVAGPAANRSGVDAVMTNATAAIGGRVIDSAGQPTGGVSITLEGADVVRRTITSDEPPGEYLFDALPPGVFTITYVRAGSSPQTLLVDLAAGERRTLPDVQLEQQASIRGTVTVDGAPRSGIGVVVYVTADYPEVVTTSIVTGQGGRFEIVGLEAPESYTVEFERPAGGEVVTSRLVSLRPGEAVEMNVELSEPPPAQPGTIQGLVTMQGEPVGDVTVVVHLSASYPDEVARVVTDGEGRFQIVGLDAPESYTLDFEWPPGEIVATRVVTVESGEVVEMLVEL